ncbi:MAG: TraR/DksA family transcriptional regulator [Deltaproteobacteria bacterium]|nr:TraR/DksA family transcriptional regulator [Deltaproteobacteria bacterium]MBI3754618.1 TraR/DksA family transcriptional regulator [Deltaproteobacteria bacterium]
MANKKKNKLKTKTKKIAKKAAAKPKKIKEKSRKTKTKSPQKKVVAKKQVKKPVTESTIAAIPTPQPVKIRVREPFKKQIIKKLLKAKEDLLNEVAEKIKNESNTLKFEIGDIYDIASNERERELTLMLGDRDREKLAEIEDALGRIENGSYGICEECGEPIAEARLLAMPFAKVCIDCKSKDERERGARRRYEEEPGMAMLEKTEAEEEEF